MQGGDKDARDTRLPPPLRVVPATHPCHAPTAHIARACALDLPEPKPAACGGPVAVRLRCGHDTGERWAWVVVLACDGVEQGTVQLNPDLVAALRPQVEDGGSGAEGEGEGEVVCLFGCVVACPCPCPQLSLVPVATALSVRVVPPTTALGTSLGGLSAQALVRLVARRAQHTAVSPECLLVLRVLGAVLCLRVVSVDTACGPPPARVCPRTTQVAVEGTGRRPPQSALEPQALDSLADVVATVQCVVEGARQRADAPRGVLVRGPPGSGKTSLLRLLAATLRDCTTIPTNARDVESALGLVREQLARHARAGESSSVVVLLVDDVHEMFHQERKGGLVLLEALVEQLCAERAAAAVVATSAVVARTPSHVTQVRRLEVSLELPSLSLSDRSALFATTLCARCAVPDAESRQWGARLAPLASGFLPCDVVRACRLAARNAVERACHSEGEGGDGGGDCSSGGGDSSGGVLFGDVEQAVSSTTPSSLGAVRAQKMQASFADVAGYEEVKAQLGRIVLSPFRHPERAARFGFHTGFLGVVLHGDAGVGKTLLARALIGELGVGAIAVRASDWLSKYFGDSERAVRRVFAAARLAAPCVVFIDEVDSVGGRRDGGDESGSRVNERVLTTLLTEMDGVGANAQVIVVACTNRLDAIDDALLRPGRLEHHILVPLPSPHDKEAVATRLMQQHCVRASVEDVRQLISTLRSPAEIELLFQEGGVCALRRDPNATHVTSHDLHAALRRIKAI